MAAASIGSKSAAQGEAQMPQTANWPIERRRDSILGEKRSMTRMWDARKRHRELEAVAD
jgi:hypothetical protein